MPEPIASRPRRPMYEIGSPPPRRRSRLWLIGLPMFAVFAAFGSIVWVAYVDSAPGSAVGEPPLIKADVSPIKLSPDDPGGRVVADQGEVRQLLGDEATPQLERLLPPPEQPLTLPDETETAALGESGERPAADAADQAPGAEQQVTEPGGAPAGEQEPVVATTTLETTTPEPSAPAPQAGPEEGTAGGPPSNGGEIDATPEPSPANQDAEAALEALLAEVTGERSGPSDASPGQNGDDAARPEGSDVAPSPGSVAAAQPDPGDDDVAAASPGTGAGASDAGGRTAAASGVPVEPMPSQSRSGSSEASYRIQLAAVRDEADARRAWDLFQDDLGDVLAELDPVIERAETANGVFYRVQVGEFASLDNAEALCDRLKQRNASCFVIRR